MAASCIPRVGDRLAELRQFGQAISKGGWIGSKKSEVIDVVVDELALSLVGWQVEDAQARLVTESHSEIPTFMSKMTYR